MELFVRVTPLRAGTAEAVEEGELFRCPADVEADTILSFLTQKFGEVVETAWTSTDRHPRLACGWIFAGLTEQRDGREFLCVPIVETGDGSLQPMFKVLADQRLEYDELGESGVLDNVTVIDLTHLPYGAVPRGDGHGIGDGPLPRTPIDACKTPIDLVGLDTKSPTNVVSTGGGHRHGAGRAGTTEFPATWTDDQVVRNILSVARGPDRTPVWQENHRWRVRGHVDGVEIIVILKSDGQIVTAWPLPGGRGVQQNPAWSTNANEIIFAANMKRLPNCFCDRLSGENMEALHMMALAGEWAEEIDLLIAGLAATQQSVTSQERKDLQNLLTQLGMPVEQLQEVRAAGH